jgi:hypothetical protein
LTLLELRAWQLEPAVSLRVEEAFFGCFSFVDLAAGLPDNGAALTLQGARPALDDTQFAVRQRALRERLARVTCRELQLERGA